MGRLSGRAARCTGRGCCHRQGSHDVTPYRHGWADHRTRGHGVAHNSTTAEGAQEERRAKQSHALSCPASQPDGESVTGLDKAGRQGCRHAGWRVDSPCRGSGCRGPQKRNPRCRGLQVSCCENVGSAITAPHAEEHSDQQRAETEHAQ